MLNVKKTLNKVTTSYAQSAPQVFLDKRCNGYLVTNAGTSTVYIDDMPLYPGDPTATPPIPGQSLSVSLDRDEVFDPAYISIRFSTGGNNMAILTQVWYHENQGI